MTTLIFEVKVNGHPEDDPWDTMVLNGRTDTEALDLFVAFLGPETTVRNVRII